MNASHNIYVVWVMCSLASGTEPKVADYLKTHTHLHVKNTVVPLVWCIQQFIFFIYQCAV